MSKGTLESFIDEASRERGLDQHALRAALRDFIRALHETDFRSSYFSSEDGGYLAQVYLSLGPEAAFHLVEFMARQGKGHDPDAMRTELQYIDNHAYRFGTTIQRWQAEVDVEFANRQEESGT